MTTFRVGLFNLISLHKLAPNARAGFSVDSVTERHPKEPERHSDAKSMSPCDQTTADRSLKALGNLKAVKATPPLESTPAQDLAKLS